MAKSLYGISFALKYLAQTNGLSGGIAYLAF
jgi:hypothetical protein